MTTVILHLTPESALIKDPESEEGQLQNLLLDVMCGLEYKDLDEEEKSLLTKHGYIHED